MGAFNQCISQGAVGKKQNHAIYLQQRELKRENGALRRWNCREARWDGETVTNSWKPLPLSRWGDKEKRCSPGLGSWGHLVEPGPGGLVLWQVDHSLRAHHLGAGAADAVEAAGFHLLLSPSIPPVLPMGQG